MTDDFELSLIQERVRAGLAHAKAKGKRLGRVPAVVDLGAAHKLRGEGLGLRGTAKRMGISVNTLRKAWARLWASRPTGKTYGAHPEFCPQIEYAITKEGSDPLL